jgi:hypothetical protein
MAGIRIEGNTSGNVAEVDASNNLKVSAPVTLDTKVGFVALAGRNDDGSIVAAGRLNRAYVSEGNKLAVANAVLLWDDTFNSLAQNTSKYKWLATTQTGSQAAGYLILNTLAVTTINTNCAIQTTKAFPLFGKSELRCNMSGMLTQVPQANQVIEFGMFSATLPGAAAPTDGVFYRYNTAGELRGVISYGGTETQTAAITAPSASVNHDFVIVTQTNSVLFYIDDILRGVINLLTDAPTLGQPMMAASQPFTARMYIGASAPALATQLKISDVFITQLGADPSRPWAEQKSGLGHSAYQGQNGGTMGTTALYASNANPAATVPTNTTAALGSGLGGKFQETLTLVAATDGIISSFQNPVGGVNQTPRNLIIRGVTISGVVTVVLTGTALAGTLALCYGHTAVSLATAESGSFVTPSTKAPRRIAIATTGLAALAAVGIQVSGTPVAIKFDTPITVLPGEFVAISHNKVAAAPTTGAVMWSITFDAYFE